jgi:2-keto-4-pentenoate hydratase/2-oxohepta-3-ene-1,7-dioic acid hydratase in catechol pathway
MRYVRIQTALDQPKFGWIWGDKVGEMEGTPFGEYRRMEAEVSLEKVHLLAPVIPGKIIGVEINFQQPSPEASAELPDFPSIFIKPPSTIIGPGEAIQLPTQSKLVDHEVHLAVILGLTGRWIAPERSKDYIFGYTVATDITARDLQAIDHHLGRAKSFDTFLSLGPWIETELDVIDTLVTCRVSGELRQMASTREMFFPVPQLLAFVSSIMTLYPGDVILSGSPAGAGPLAPGDIVQSSIEGIGDLINPVVKESV